MSLLILVRHGESTWNSSDKITGQADIPLTNKGREQARLIGQELSSINIDKAYVSLLQRTVQTLDEIQDQLGSERIQTQKSSSLNERDYGDFTGELKKNIITAIGQDRYNTILRGWNTMAPNGESLEMVYNRVVPYFKKKILVDLEMGKNVLVVSHHHTLRALIKYIEIKTNDEISFVRINNSEAIIYNFDNKNKMFKRK